MTTSRRPELDEAKAPPFQSVDPAACRLTGRALSRLVLAMVKRATAAAGQPPATCYVPGDGDHGVSVERGDARARAADRRARLAEDDEALRPDGGHDHRRRGRAHRHLSLRMLPEITLPCAGAVRAAKRGWALLKSANLYRSLSCAKTLAEITLLCAERPKPQKTGSAWMHLATLYRSRS